MDDNQRDKKLELLKNQAKVLRQSFDTVQIFVGKNDEETGVTTMYWGDGNYYARYGQIRQWLLQEDEQARMEVRDR